MPDARSRPGPNTAGKTAVTHIAKPSVSRQSKGASATRMSRTVPVLKGKS